MASVKEYVRGNNLERIRFPQLTAEQIFERGWFIWGEEIWNLSGA